MSFITRLFGLDTPKDAGRGGHPQALGEGFYGLDDPALAPFLRGAGTATGLDVTTATAMRNTSVLRCYAVISNAIGRLPLHLMLKGGEAGDVKATDHPLFRVLHRQPNGWQTAFNFRRLMQGRALLFGNAYAVVVRTGARVSALIPVHPSKVKVVQGDDWAVRYEVTRERGGVVNYQPADFLHIRGPGDDALVGESMVRLAAEAIGLAQAAERASARIFRNGAMVGGALTTDKALSVGAIDRLRSQFNELHQGVDNAGKWIIGEEGLKPHAIGMSARDAELLALRKHQVEEVARVFGVPRPLLMVDDTSWGTGIEQLGIYLVQHGLAPWFEAWEQEISRVLLTRAEQDKYEAKFNEGALLRGSMKDQAEYLRKLVGTGQDPAMMMQNEARRFLGLGDHPDGNSLSSGMGGMSNAA